jgi:phosphate transport system permease protein
MDTYRCPNDTRKGLVETLIESWLFVAAMISAIAVGAILFFLIYFAWPIFHEDHFWKLLSWYWRPFQNQFGILPMVAGSVLLGISSMLLAYPMGIGVCCCVYGLGPRWLSGFTLTIVRIMTSVPTVVYGFVSVFLLVPFLREFFYHGSGFSWLAATLTLSLLVLPTVTLIVNAQFELFDPEIRLATTALGFSPIKQLIWVVIPASYKGLLAAAVLGFGRAVGDTIISLMVSGNSPQFPHSMLDSIRTLTAHVALVVSTEAGSMAYNSLFAAGIMLFGVSALVNGALRFIRAGSE